MKKYEVMYIIRPEVEETERNNLIEEVNRYLQRIHCYESQ